MLKKLFLGSNPITSIAGYVLAGLMALDEMLKSGQTDWLRIAVAVGIAVLGRVAGDTTNTK